GMRTAAAGIAERRHERAGSLRAAHLRSGRQRLGVGRGFLFGAWLLFDLRAAVPRSAGERRAGPRRQGAAHRPRRRLVFSSVGLARGGSQSRCRELCVIEYWISLCEIYGRKIEKGRGMLRRTCALVMVLMMALPAIAKGAPPSVSAARQGTDAAVEV